MRLPTHLLLLSTTLLTAAHPSHTHHRTHNAIPRSTETNLITLSIPDLKILTQYMCSKNPISANTLKPRQAPPSLPPSALTSLLTAIQVLETQVIDLLIPKNSSPTPPAATRISAGMNVLAEQLCSKNLDGNEAKRRGRGVEDTPPISVPASALTGFLAAVQTLENEVIGLLLPMMNSTNSSMPAPPAPPPPPARFNVTDTMAGEEVAERPNSEAAWLSSSRNVKRQGPSNVSPSPSPPNIDITGEEITATATMTATASAVGDGSGIASVAGLAAAGYTFRPMANDNVAVYYGQTPATANVSLLEVCKDPDVVCSLSPSDYFPPLYPNTKSGA